jgi:hypothetical protein
MNDQSTALRQRQRPAPGAVDKGLRQARRAQRLGPKDVVSHGPSSELTDLNGLFVDGCHASMPCVAFDALVKRLRDQCGAFDDLHEVAFRVNQDTRDAQLSIVRLAFVHQVQQRVVAERGSC